MGWIKVDDNLEVYSITDDMIMLFEAITEMIANTSPYYFGIYLGALIIIIFVSVAYKLRIQELFD